MAIVRKCTQCGEHTSIAGSSNKPDEYGQRRFICADCVLKNSINESIEKKRKS